MTQARSGFLMKSQPTISWFPERRKTGLDVLNACVPPQDLECVVYIHFEEGVGAIW